MSYFADKGVVVTGAGGGIGAAIATGFASEGALVACVDMDGDSAETVAASISQAGGKAWAFCCDVSDPAEVENLVPLCKEKLGDVAVLVANAGGSQGEVIPFLDMSMQRWQAMLDRNLTSVFVSCRAFAAEMATGGGGAIVVVSSQLSVVVRPGMAHYTAAKGAVTQLVKAMAVDLAPMGIRVNALAPGPTLTPGNEAFFTQPEVEEAHRRAVPAGRIARPEEMVGAALYLAGDTATYTTGATLMVDGGYTIV